MRLGAQRNPSLHCQGGDLSPAPTGWSWSGFLSSFSHLPSPPCPSQKGSNSSQVTNPALSPLTLRKLGIYLKPARLSSPSRPEKDLQITSRSLQTCISLKTRNMFFSQAPRGAPSSGIIPTTAPASAEELPPYVLIQIFKLPSNIPKFSCSLQMVPYTQVNWSVGRNRFGAPGITEAGTSPPGALDAKAAAWQGGGSRPSTALSRRLNPALQWSEIHPPSLPTRMARGEGPGSRNP